MRGGDLPVRTLRCGRIEEDADGHDRGEGEEDERAEKLAHGVVLGLHQWAGALQVLVPDRVNVQNASAPTVPVGL